MQLNYIANYVMGNSKLHYVIASYIAAYLCLALISLIRSNPTPNSPMYSLNYLIHFFGLASFSIFSNIALSSPFLVLNIYCAKVSFIFISLPFTVDATISPCSAATGVHSGSAHGVVTY